MWPLAIEKPLMRFQGTYSKYKNTPWKLFALAIPAMLLAGVAGPTISLASLPFVIIGCLAPISMGVAYTARHYEQDEPHYKAARSQIYGLLHFGWILLTYFWFAFWIIGLILGMFAIIACSIGLPFTEGQCSA